MSAKDIDISIDEGVLRVSGERKIPMEMKDENVHCIERDYGRFERRIALPHKVDEKRVRASYAGGVLKLELPKVGAEQPRRIPIIAEEAEKMGE
jgi:HSP20 family protein